MGIFDGLLRGAQGVGQNLVNRASNIQVPFTNSGAGKGVGNITLGDLSRNIAPAVTSAVVPTIKTSSDLVGTVGGWIPGQVGRTIKAQQTQTDNGLNDIVNQAHQRLGINDQNLAIQTANLIPKLVGLGVGFTSGGSEAIMGTKIATGLANAGMSAKALGLLGSVAEQSPAAGRMLANFVLHPETDINLFKAALNPKAAGAGLRLAKAAGSAVGGSVGFSAVNGALEGKSASQVGKDMVTNTAFTGAGEFGVDALKIAAPHIAAFLKEASTSTNQAVRDKLQQVGEHFITTVHAYNEPTPAKPLHPEGTPLSEMNPSAIAHAQSEKAIQDHNLINANQIVKAKQAEAAAAQTQVTPQGVRGGGLTAPVMPGIEKYQARAAAYKQSEAGMSQAEMVARDANAPSPAEMKVSDNNAVKPESAKVPLASNPATPIKVPEVNPNGSVSGDHQTVHFPSQENINSYRTNKASANANKTGYVSGKSDIVIKNSVGDVNQRIPYDEAVKKWGTTDPHALSHNLVNGDIPKPPINKDALLPNQTGSAHANQPVPTNEAAMADVQGNINRTAPKSVPLTPAQAEPKIASSGLVHDTQGGRFIDKATGEVLPYTATEAKSVKELPKAADIKTTEEAVNVNQQFKDMQTQSRDALEKQFNQAGIKTEDIAKTIESGKAPQELKQAWKDWLDNGRHHSEATYGDLGDNYWHRMSNEAPAQNMNDLFTSEFDAAKTRTGKMTDYSTDFHKVTDSLIKQHADAKGALLQEAKAKGITVGEVLERRNVATEIKTAATKGEVLQGISTRLYEARAKANELLQKQVTLAEERLAVARQAAAEAKLSGKVASAEQAAIHEKLVRQADERLKLARAAFAQAKQEKVSITGKVGVMGGQLTDMNHKFNAVDERIEKAFNPLINAEHQAAHNWETEVKNNLTTTKDLTASLTRTGMPSDSATKLASLYTEQVAKIGKNKANVLLQSALDRFATNEGRNKLIEFMSTHKVEGALGDFVDKTASGLLGQNARVQTVSQLFVHHWTSNLYKAKLGLNLMSAGQQILEARRVIALEGRPGLAAFVKAIGNKSLRRQYGVHDMTTAEALNSISRASNGKFGPRMLADGMQHSSDWMMIPFQKAEGFKDEVVLRAAESRAKRQGLSGQDKFDYVMKYYNNHALKYGKMGTITGFDNTGMKLLGQLGQYNVKNVEHDLEMLKRGFGKSGVRDQHSAKEARAFIMRSTLLNVGTAAMLAPVGVAWSQAFGFPQASLGPTVQFGQELYNGIMAERVASEKEGRAFDPSKAVSRTGRKLVASTLIPGGNQLIDKSGVQGLIPDNAPAPAVAIKNFFKDGAIQDMNRGYNESASGRTRFLAPTDTAGKVTSIALGTNATQESQQYFKNKTTAFSEKQTQSVKDAGDKKAAYDQVLSDRVKRKEDAAAAATRKSETHFKIAAPKNKLAKTSVRKVSIKTSVRRAKAAPKSRIHLTSPRGGVKIKLAKVKSLTPHTKLSLKA